ncbi:MAG TPA: saccharopine dehydrogenase NADP-binding domain-containing protein [Thermoleophilaceae bacterium]|nr:saccharopine dehydrogenase NADP-binding domain-containing protein [Thermoleophilaceae bacterium]
MAGAAGQGADRINGGLRTAVLGAGGIIAPAIVRDLAESEEVGELLLLDLDGERAAAVAKTHGGPRARAAEVDARGGLADALGDVDVLVNSASYRVNLDAMRACLEAGSHYVDLGGLYWMTGDQLELSPEFERAGLLALLGMGSSPGKTNVMAARAVRELGERPRRVDVIAAGRDLDPPDGASFPYALQTLVDELTLDPMAQRGGEPTALAPLQPGGAVDLPEPIGHADTIYTLHSEVRTFPSSFGCRECSFRLSLSPKVLERVRGLVAADELELAAASRAAMPASPQTVSVHRVEAEGVGGSVTVTATTGPVEEWDIGGSIVSTAAPAAAAVRLLARGRIAARGALPPELCVEPDDLFPELERRSCRFEVEVHAHAVADGGEERRPDSEAAG